MQEERRKNESYGRRSDDSDIFKAAYSLGVDDTEANYGRLFIASIGLMLGVIVVTYVTVLFPNLLADPIGSDKIGFLPLFLGGMIIAVGQTTYEPVRKKFGRYATILNWICISAAPSVIVFMAMAGNSGQSYYVAAAGYSLAAIVSLIIVGSNDRSSRASLRRDVRIAKSRGMAIR